MSPQSIVRLITVQPFQLFFAFISGIFQLLFAFTKRSRPKLRSSSSQSRQMRSAENELQNGRNIYDEYDIVVEQCLSLNIPPYNNYSNGSTFNSNRAWIDGKKWEFSVIRQSTSQHTLRLALLEMDLACASVNAEVIFWQWHRGKQIYIMQKSLKSFQYSNSQVQLQYNTTNANALPSDGHFYVLIRLLEKRPIVENPCPTFDEDENVTLLVGPESFAISQHYLMSLSPVFEKMFSLEMREKAQRQVVLEEIGPEEFKSFLEAIFPRGIHPNPYNVAELLKLADRFQVEFLRMACEEHLINCVEVSLVERLLCAEIYRLEKLKNFILKSLSGSGLRDFYEENQRALNMLSKDLLIQLTSRICTRSTAPLCARTAKGT